MDEYLREVCGLEPEKVGEVEFKQEECGEFWGWIVGGRMGQGEG